MPHPVHLHHRPAAVVVLVALVASLLLGTALGAAAVVRPDTVEQVPGAGTWPLSPTPTVVTGFDPPDLRWAAGHRGVDLAGRPGQPVLAALPGIISFSGSIAGRGVVVVDHGATRTTYEPVVAGAPVGTPVTRGQAIGTLAAIGSHCFPIACLHWGWRRGDIYLNPLALVGPRPVRLLPLAGLLAPIPMLAPRCPPELFPAVAPRRGDPAAFHTNACTRG